MATKIFLAVAREDGNGSMTVIVTEDFDTVINRIFPATNPSSALEARQNQLFRTVDGRQLMVHPGNVFLLEEDPEED